MRANLTAENQRNQAIIRQFNVEGVPTTVFIDGTGKIRKTRVGYVGPAEFVRYLHECGARSASLGRTRFGMVDDLRHRQGREFRDGIFG